MLQESIEHQLSERANGDDEYLRPDYDGYCFANVPGTLIDLVGGRSARTLPSDAIPVKSPDFVVCLVVDGLAYHNWKRDLGEHDVVDWFTDAGTVTPITSVYPSETAAAMTTFNTGLDPLEHGILGWDQYVPAIDDVVEPLPFTLKDDTPVAEAYPDTDPSILFSEASWYDDAAEMGIDTVSICLGGLGETAGRLVGTGARTDEYRSIPSLGERVAAALESMDSPGIVTAYVNHLDSISHSSGTESDLYHTTAEQIGEAFEELLGTVDEEIAARTLAIITADHGHLERPNESNVDITEYEEIYGLLRTDSAGDPIPPVGGPRNVRFHVRESEVETLRAILEEEFDGLVFSRAEMLAQGLFGRGDPPEDFAARCGDLLCIPRENCICWEESDLTKVGQHGGLHPEEMLVPFGVSWLDKLGTEFGNDA